MLQSKNSFSACNANKDQQGHTILQKFFLAA